MSFVDDIAALVATSKYPLVQCPADWPRAKLGTVAKIVNGYPFPSSDFKASAGIPVARIRDVVRGRSDTLYGGPVVPDALISDGDLLVGMDGDFNLGRWRGGRALLNQRVCKIVTDSAQLDERYLAHILPGYLKLINENTPSTTVKHLSSRTLASVPLPLPPISVQRRVADRIDELFSELYDGEEGLARVRSHLEVYRKSLLRAAVTGKLTAAWREANPIAESGEQLLARVIAGQGKKQAARQSAISETDLPILPPEWVWCRNDQAGRVQLGRQRTPKDHDGPYMHPYLRVANVYEDRLELSDVKQMNFSPTEFEKFQLRHGDILLNEGQSLELVGRPAMFRGEIVGCCFQNTLVRFQAGSEVDPAFALLSFLFAMHTGRFERIAKITTNIAHLGAGRFAELGFPLAPIAEQREAVRLFNERICRFDDVAEIRAASQALRQSILAAAFRGELVQ